MELLAAGAGAPLLAGAGVVFLGGSPPPSPSPAPRPLGPRQGVEEMVRPHSQQDLGPCLLSLGNVLEWGIWAWHSVHLCPFLGSHNSHSEDNSSNGGHLASHPFGMCSRNFWLQKHSKGDR